VCVARKIHAVEKERKKERSQTDHTRERERQRMKNKERIVARDGHRIRRIALKKRESHADHLFSMAQFKMSTKKKRERKRCRDIKLPSLSKSAPA
jgi:hypothetical protein